MAKWLVTGGAGFIGSHIVESLIKKGEKVRVLDSFVTGKKEYLQNVLGKIELRTGDIRDPGTVESAVRGMDYLLHQAAMRSVPQSIEKPQECNSVNIDGTLNCLIASNRAKVKRFVFASSSSIYGNSTHFPQEEKDIPEPISPYAVTKISGEYYCRMFSKTYGLSTVSLRYFNVYGPRQDPKSKYAAVVPKFIIHALKGTPIEVHWDGKQSRDFTCVLDVAEANILAATAKNLTQDVYNVACGDCTSLLKIIQTLEKIMKIKLPRRFSPKREGDVRKTYASISPLRKDMKFNPQINFQAGLKKTLEFFSEKNRWKDY